MSWNKEEEEATTSMPSSGSVSVMPESVVSAAEGLSSLQTSPVAATPTKATKRKR